MSVEKFNPSVRGESIPYLQANRHVIQNITNAEALAVWIYLLSLPADWNIVKEHVQKHFDIGQKKLRSIFSYLKRVNLVDYVQVRRQDGKMGEFEVIVLNGSRFNDGTLDLSTEITGGAETARAVNGWGGKEALHIKQNTDKILNKKSFCEKDEKAKATNLKDWKDANQKKHSWADGNKESPRADVTKQSTSYDPDKHSNTGKFDPNSPGYQAFVDSVPALRRRHQKRKEASQAAQLPAGTAVSTEVSSGEHISQTSSEHALDAASYLAPELRRGDRLMETRGARSYFEKAGLASEDHLSSA